MTIKIWNYNNDLKSFTDVIDLNFWIKSIDKTNLIKWKFFKNCNSKKNITICSYLDKKIIWQYSNISHIFSFKNKDIMWYLCQDMCVNKDYRWKWLLVKMSKKLYSEINDNSFTVGFSNDLGVKVDKGSKSYWYNIVDNLKSYYYPE